MVKKKIVEEQALEDVDVEIPEESLPVVGQEQIKITETIASKKTNKGISKYNSFMNSQRKLIVEDVSKILKNTLLETFEERAQIKLQKKMEQEQLKKQKEEEELFEAFKKFKEIGLTPAPTQETVQKPVPKASKEKLECEFCKKEITRHSYPKHVASCFENPNGKHAEKLKHKFKVKTEINVPETEEEKTERAIKKNNPKTLVIERTTNKINPKRPLQTKYDDIW